ncbi:hypothetical protein B1812_19780 [Methylocystis bryophila]|uniref:Uncharacterized protein n=1 Tax=Methylocystis bryophila TaxID=655015 RepID=A0A1W6MZC3_9HYPH|nr:hypothetical protein B1812_19780 [Methylocystis bryophila]
MTRGEDVASRDVKGQASGYGFARRERTREAAATPEQWSRGSESIQDASGRLEEPGRGRIQRSLKIERSQPSRRRIRMKAR